MRVLHSAPATGLFFSDQRHFSAQRGFRLRANFTICVCLGSVTAGQTATFSLQLTSGFDGSVAFTCAGAPVSATCSVPTAISVTSGVTVPFVITVATAGSNTTGQLWRRPPDVPSGGPRSPYLLVLWYLLAGSALWATAPKTVGYVRGPGAQQRLAYGPALVGCAILALYAMAGCGGVSTVAQSAPIAQAVPTPAGTSVISVTPTATSKAGTPLAAIAPIQLTLTVN